MTGFLHSLRTTCISLEVLAVLVLVMCWYHFPEAFRAGDKVVASVPAHLMVVPFGPVLFYVLLWANRILIPKTQFQKLRNWPGYGRLFITTFAGVAFCVLGGAAVAIGSFAQQHFPNGVSCLLVSSGYVVAFLSALSTFAASIMVRAILAR